MSRILFLLPLFVGLVVLPNNSKAVDVEDEFNLCDEGFDHANPLEVTNPNCVTMISEIGVAGNYGAYDSYSPGASAAFCDPDGAGPQPNDPNSDSCRAHIQAHVINQMPIGNTCVAGARAYSLDEDAIGDIANPLWSNSTSESAAYDTAFMIAPLASGSTLSSHQVQDAALAAIGMDIPDLSQTCDWDVAPLTTYYASNIYVQGPPSQTASAISTIAWVEGNQPEDDTAYSALLLIRLMYNLINPDGTSAPPDELLQFVSFDDPMRCEYTVDSVVEVARFESQWAVSHVTYDPKHDNERVYGPGRMTMFARPIQEFIDMYDTGTRHVNWPITEALVSIPGGSAAPGARCYWDIGDNGFDAGDIVVTENVYIRREAGVSTQ